MLVTIGIAVLAPSTRSSAQELFVNGFEGGSLAAWSSFYSGEELACEVPRTIDFCRLQFPTSIAQPEGSQITVYGRLYIAGLTDQTTGNDVAPEVSAYLGYGPDGSDPAVDPGWVWSRAAPNPGWNDAVEQNNDEYQDVLSVPSPGEYDFAYAFSGDCGATFTYCDAGDGNSNGYATADAGQMTATSALFFSEYVEGSSNNKALEILNSSSGAVSLDGCEIRMYFSGSVTAGTTVPLSGNLAGQDIHVVCHEEINPIVDSCDQYSGASFYNGDDAVALVCSGETVDVIGQIGNDPGTEWLVGGVGTADATLRRKCLVVQGDGDGGNAFDPSAEWLALASDTFAGLESGACAP